MFTSELSTLRQSQRASLKGSQSRCRWRALIVVACAVALSLRGSQIISAQTFIPASAENDVANGELSLTQRPGATLARYIDPSSGTTADEAVADALAHNGELLAVRKEVEAAQASIKQATLKPNPKLDVQRREQIGGPDNDTMIGARLPLELGGRRAARVSVAERELALREQTLADAERQLAAAVRAKFGASLAAALKLGFDEELLDATQSGYKLVAARVNEGRTAPLEQNMVLVEVNRLRSLREADAGKVEVSLLELRNLIGMEPDASLRLRGDFNDLLDRPSPLIEATTRALQERPDLLAARAAEGLAGARIEQARAGGRLDAELTGQYERNNFSFSQSGINSAGQLVPIQGIFHSVAVGVTLDLPVRNKNQGAVEAAFAQAEAAKRRREFAELTVRREVAAAYARYESAARAMEIFRTGVRRQADMNLNVIRQTYELGAKTLLDYITEQRRYIELENGFIDALLETYEARVEIERAAATPELIKR